MSSGNLDRRMNRIETQIEATGCPGCRDRPPVEIRLTGEAIDQPESCARCGRDFGASIIWIGVREDGPR